MPHPSIPNRSVPDLGGALGRLERSEIVDQHDAELLFAARGDDLERLLVGEVTR